MNAEATGPLFQNRRDQSLILGLESGINMISGSGGIKRRRPITSRMAPNLTKDIPYGNSMDSMHRSMGSIILLAQCFGLLPVQGITGQGVDNFRFSWKNLRVLYTFSIMLMMVVNMGFTTVIIVNTNLNFQTAGGFVYFLIGWFCCFLFLKLATRWPELALLWNQTEKSQERYGYPKNLRQKMRIMTYVVLFVAAVEFGLAQGAAILIASYCSTGGMDLLRKYFIVYSTHIFHVAKYSPALAIFAFLSNLVAAFYWSFSNLFVMLICVGLASRFRLINNQLEKVRGKVMAESFWRGIREDYNAISYLTYIVDSHVSSIIFLCFATNLFYICQQLLYSLAPAKHIVRSLYVYISFGYLLLRTIAMALFASTVYEESKQAKIILYSVPAQNYQVEVHRFLVQVATDNVALTGLNFFPVTRTVLLTLAGTIITYEVVLVQFGSVTIEVYNSTELCVNLTEYAIST